MLGFAVGQLFYGPLSDRFGRRPVLLGGLIFFTAATFGCSFAPSIGGLIGLRILQGLGAASGSVLGRALTRDAYTFQEMPLVMSWISLGQNIAPSLAPTLGGFLGEWWAGARRSGSSAASARCCWRSRCSASRETNKLSQRPHRSRQPAARLGRDAARPPVPRQRADARASPSPSISACWPAFPSSCRTSRLLAARVRPDRAAVGRRLHRRHPGEQPAGRPRAADRHHARLGLVPRRGSGGHGRSFRSPASSPGGRSSARTSC